MARRFHGWSVVGCAFLIAVWGWGLGFYGLGVYLVSLQSAHGWSTFTISGAITAYYLVGAGLIALLGPAIARFGPASTVRTGIAAMALGVVALTAIREPWQLYAAFLVMGVGWSTMSGAALNILVAPWFERRRGLAGLAFTPASGRSRSTVGGLAALLLWRPSAAALYVGCIIVGLGVGNMVSLPGLLVAREFSPAQFASVVSLVTATNQVAFAFAPALMGVLRDATGSYGAALAALSRPRRDGRGRSHDGSRESRGRGGDPDASASSQLRVL